MATQQVYDVIIVGGGPAGCATALALHRIDSPRSVLLIDDADPAIFKIGESLPGIALQTLAYLSPTLSDSLSHDIAQGDHARCSGNASVWSSQELHEEYSLTRLYGSGWHLDRPLFDESLRQAVREGCDKSKHNSLPSRIVREQFVSIEKHDGIWCVHTKHLDTGSTNCYYSKWAVDATGRKASLARKLGATTLKTDKLLAFYSLFVSPEDDGDRRTLIEATESGWWYTSSLPHNRRVVVYHTDDDDPSAKLVRTADGFLDLLHNHTQHISSIITTHHHDFFPGQKFPRSTSANSSVLDLTCDETEHWCAVGDAAMAFDPLSSQGMITALNAGCFIGEELAKRISMESEGAGSEEISSILDYYAAITQQYEKEKKQYYRLARFNGGFWAKRQV